MQSPRLRILCAEDHADTCELIRLILSYHNCDVITAETSLQAMELARAESFDLYLLDNWIPGMSGTDLCRALRLVDSETPILFYSGAASPKDKAEAYASGAQGYLVKPSDPDELVTEVFRVISENRRGRSRSEVGMSVRWATA